MITFLSGGTGTPKLLRGMRHAVDDASITVIVNTGEDIWMSGGHIAPDLDTVMYLFAGTLNTDTWWGIRGDTFITHEALTRFETGEYIAIGDRDRAVQITRGELLRSGSGLTAATAALCQRLGVRAAILPMTDIPVTSMVRTPEGLMHFQEYWVKHRGTVAISRVERLPDPHPPATPEVITAIRESEAIVIGPSNPITSILPILDCAGVRNALAGKEVIGISPFIGSAPVSGPAGALMEAAGYHPDSSGTAQLYDGLVTLFIQDIRDPVRVPGSLRVDTLMTDEQKSQALASEVIRLIREH
ncbi:MAG: 2-phospho-L-lactate transferase [Methanoregulaceae archaeon]|nr:2-phospho-L-lactate transferase [Methanoregulaceae archaeon]